MKDFICFECRIVTCEEADRILDCVLYQHAEQHTGGFADPEDLFQCVSFMKD